MIFITNSQEHFQSNSATHSVNTRNKNQIHRPTANLSCFQKSAYYAGNNIFNSLSSSLTSLINKKAQFKVTSKRYLIAHYFYSVDEFLMSVKVFLSLHTIHVYYNASTVYRFISNISLRYVNPEPFGSSCLDFSRGVNLEEDCFIDRGNQVVTLVVRKKRT
jgi:hypothetical protein